MFTSISKAVRCLARKPSYWFKQLTNQHRQKRSCRAHSAFASDYRLEPRQLLAGISFDVPTSKVHIDGTSGDDTSTIVQVNETSFRVSLQGFGSQVFDYADVSGILFRGFDGNDYVRNEVNVSSRLVGHDGADILIGGPANDRIDGGNGNDRILGKGGVDRLAGDGGNDTILGGVGADVIYGGSGENRIQGESGNDLIFGGEVRDIIDGGSGNDTIQAVAGSDIVSGGDGNDTIYGGDGFDSILGGNGNDRLFGHSGNDVIDGGAGNDQIEGNTGIDRLSGKDGNDVIRGGDSNDTLYGNGGEDTLHGDSGNDVIDGGAQADLIYAGSGNDNVNASSGSDRVYGGSGNDVIKGGIGNDILFGNDGEDEIRGQEGNDEIRGGNANDSLFGDDGADRIFGEAGQDLLRGYSGDDFLSGGDGNDLLYGGSGGDRLIGDRDSDRLFGEGGRDILEGGQGKDALFGGTGGGDRLTGGTQSDRFLMWTGDVVTDAASQDARMLFKNVTHSWTNKEIEIIDRGFERMEVVTGNNSILRDSLDTDPVVYEKHGPDSNIALNRLRTNTVTTHFPNGSTSVERTYDRFILYYEWNEDNTAQNEIRVDSVAHEIAHSWDSQLEMTARFNDLGNLFNSFKAISNWRETNPNSSNYRLSGDGEWWYRADAEFVRNYSRHNPREDWATLWEVVFNDDANQATRQRLAQKLNSVNTLISRF
ncbi:MAG: calcium-binding protein [Planctomycetota bacterium]